MTKFDILAVGKAINWKIWPFQKVKYAESHERTRKYLELLYVCI